jgi:hypothetical protein
MSTLIIPIDASQVSEKERGQQKVKVAVREGTKTKSQIVSVETGKAEVRIDVDHKRSLEIAVGPANASDEDIFRLQTLTASVSPSLWAKDNALTLNPIAITPVYWRWWWIWCREFTITGRVVCADGSPVPGAEVSAYDVDFFWWWSSIFQVGSTATTDANGNFSMSFRWCCGWWPWWWWSLRYWRLEPILVEKLYPVLKLHPNLNLREPSPTPTLDLVSLKPQNSRTGMLTKPSLAASQDLTPELISNSRARLISALPYVQEFERLRIWPWIEWYPWFDCAPDIIFKVTQNCGGNQNRVIVDENIFQTRWDIPTNLNVTLTANQDACCIPTNNPPPEGDCVLMTEVCQIPVIEIGGNAGVAGPVGFAYPNDRDRPFSENVTLYGQFGTTAQADYYSIEYSPHGAGTWSAVPPTAMQGFSRLYFDATQPWPNNWFWAPFSPTAGVYMSRQYFEATTAGAPWGSPSGRSWIGDPDALAVISTAVFFADGAYDFRVIGYLAAGGGGADLTTYKVLDGCGEEPNTNNQVVIFLDNRVATLSPDTVHINTTEPDCGITAVRLGTFTVLPCGAETLPEGTPLEIDFFVTDPDGHLNDYSLVVKYGLSSEKNLLSTADVGSFSYIAGAGVSVGPDYSNAVTPSAIPPESAVRPIWNGGTITLHIDDAAKVFPITCCYLIELTVWKRNIVNCSGDLAYYNQVHYSFTVTV